MENPCQGDSHKIPGTWYQNRSIIKDKHNTKTDRLSKINLRIGDCTLQVVTQPSTQDRLQKMSPTPSTSVASSTVVRKEEEEEEVEEEVIE